ncbi:MAG: glycosyltransferase, partial [Oscillospiraceae bacterium]|nr:glycosyltransferase [Oscillospiraceae bacterium]
VLNITSDTNIGGAGRVILNYLRHRDSDNFDVAVLMPKGSLLREPVAETGVKVYEASGFEDTSFSLSAIKTLKAEIKAIDPDIVHTHGSLSGRIAAKSCGKKVIYTRHSVFPVSAKLKSLPGRIANRLLNEHYADRIIAVSPAARDNLTEAGLRPESIDIIMNGVERVKTLGSDELTEARARFGIQDGEFVCGILARLEEYKGHTDILDAVAELRRSGEKIRLIIAGAGQYEESIKAGIKSRGIEDCVTFAGFVSDVHTLLNVLDVQLNASYGTEATSLSLLEGMSIGLPAIVSDYGGNPYVIEDGVNGLVFKTRDTNALAECIRSLMASEEKRQELKAGALKAYEDKFTADVFAKKLEELYLRVMEG